MKRFLFFVVVATLFAACSKDGVNEISNDRGHAIPSVLYASIDTEDETRMQLDELQKTVWTEGDLVSVFYYCNGNTPFEFKGKTGDRDGRLGVLSLVEGDTEIDKIVSIYPYSEAYTMNTTKKYVSVKLPATQHYLEGSYGVGDNLMAYVGDDDSNLSHKNLCGWIKIQLKGSGIVTKITLKGNDGEQLAGDAKFYYEDFRLETLDQGGLAIGEYIETITLDCGKGVTLDAETPTEFYFVVAPHTFAKGITIEAICSDGTVMTKSTSNKLTVERNHIKPMAALPVDATILVNNEIWYTNGSTTEPTAPNDPAAFGDATIQSNTYDAEKECWVITFDKDVTEIGDSAFCGYNNDCAKLTSITIPDSVISVGAEAFSYCESLTSVTIPDSVTTIGEAAFAGCTSLKEFKGKFATNGGRCLIKDNTIIAYAEASGTTYTIPDCVTTIGGWAFWGCNSLTSVTIPDDVTTIGEGALCECHGINSITIPDSVQTIGDYAFWNCESLTSVTIGKGVTFIGIFAFDDCSSLTKIVITAGGTGETLIKGAAFRGCTSLKEVYIEDLSAWCNITFEDISFGGHPFYYNPGKLYLNGETISELIIPTNVTTIKHGSFVRLEDLKSVIIHDDVTTIERCSFLSCPNLYSVIIGSGVTLIGRQAFDYCESLSVVYCNATTPPTLSDDNVFEVNAEGRKIYVPASDDDSIINAYKAAEGWSSYKDYIFENKGPQPDDDEIWYTATAKVEPYFTDVFGATYRSNVWDSETGKGVITFSGDVTKIGNYAFYECSSLTSVTIPDSVTSIGERAFYECSSLTSVTIPDSVTTIGERAFQYCGSLTSVTIGNGVTTIGERAFWSCDSLTSVTIGDSVTTIGNEAFSECTSLKGFKGKFAADGGRCLIMDGTIIAYANASGTTYTIPDSVTTIGQYAFRNCDSLTSVTIPDSVTTIVSWAFFSCSSLTSVTIPDSVTTIGSWAFSNCSSLKTVYCKPTTPPTGGYDMFYGNAPGRRIFVPASDNDSIINAYKAKEYWSDYADYIFEDEPKPANNEIWYTNGSTTEPTTAKKPENFGGVTIQSNTYDAEKGCWIITFDKDIKEIGEEAFSGCNTITNVSIPSNVTSLGHYAFGECTNLVSIDIPDSVTTIGSYAFYNCSNLTVATIGINVSLIKESAFYNCTKLETVYCKPTTPPTAEDHIFDYFYPNFYQLPIECPIHVPTASVDDYKNTDIWMRYKNFIVADDSL